jgi:hypothetical protein
VILSHHPARTVLPSPSVLNIATCEPSDLPPCLPLSPLAATPGSPRKCCKQKTYGNTNPFRCNTYKKHGAGLQKLPTPLTVEPPAAKYPNLQTCKPSNLRTVFFPSRRSDGATSHSLVALCTKRVSHLFCNQLLPHSFSKIPGWMGVQARIPKGLLELHRRRSAAATLIALVSSNSVNYRQESLRA